MVAVTVAVFRVFQSLALAAEHRLGLYCSGACMLWNQHKGYIDNSVVLPTVAIYLSPLKF